MGGNESPYGDLEGLAEILVRLGTRDRCGVALLVRAEWPIAKARHNLIHRHPWFHGLVMLTSRPRWVPREQETASPRHNFAWVIWARNRAKGMHGSDGRGRPAKSRRTPLSALHVEGATPLARA